MMNCLMINCLNWVAATRWTKKKRNVQKILELSKIQIFDNWSFKATFNAPVNHSNLVYFLEAKMLSHIESKNEMTGIDV